MFIRHSEGFLFILSLSMPWGLKRYQQARHLHFITFCCYHCSPHFNTPEAKNTFVSSLERRDAGMDSMLWAMSKSAKDCATRQVGIEHNQSIGDESALRILVEKDFRCLQPRSDDDESDNFPNQNAPLGSIRFNIANASRSQARARCPRLASRGWTLTWVCNRNTFSSTLSAQFSATITELRQELV